MTDFQTKKRFGQNFLTDKNLLSGICHDADVNKDDTVIEIGAGLGALTKELSFFAKKVISYEIDGDLKEHLLSLDLKNVEFRFKDVLKCELSEIEAGVNRYKLVANLPYYITSPIIFKFLESEKIESMCIMVQKEVAERIVALKGKDYGVLSVSILSLGSAKIMRNVSRKMFSPEPNVDSAIVLIKINKKPDLNYKDFFEFVKKLFSMRRKTLLNNLTLGYKISKEKALNIFSQEFLNRRAESLSVDEIIKAYKTFSSYNLQ